MSNLDKIVKIYRSLSQIPNLAGARLDVNGTIVNSVWSQRNLERGKTSKFLRSITINPQLAKVSESLPIDISNELLSATSPSEKFRAVLRDASDKQFLEIWQNYNLTHSVDLNALDIHGNVYIDGEFGTFRWSPDEKKLLYIAEFKAPKSEPFYKRVAKKDKEAANVESANKPKGEEFLFIEDWGEQLVGKKKSVIAQYNLDSDTVEVLTGIPDDICPANVVYSPDGSYVVGIAYKTEPRKLGLIYCTNRQSTIFTLDFSGNYVALDLKNKSVKAPVFSPDGNYLIWLQRDVGGPHASCMALVKSPLPLTSNSTPTTVVDIVQNETETANGRNFYGLYNSGFVTRSFASGNRLVLSTNQRNTINTYVIDLDTGSVTEIIYDDGSQMVLDVVDDIVLVNRRNYLLQDRLAIGKLPPKNSATPITWTELTTSQTVQGLENITYEYLDLVQNSDESVTKFSAIYLGPKEAPSRSVSLIVSPHGGPHSAFANNLALETAFFLSLGHAILYINYRGSIGTGQSSVDFLLGRIGQSDVSDCILATETALLRYSWLDASKMVLVGGSHGGFLVTHLSGQYPEMFKAVIARNPVIDVASMSIISDIPDWCYVETGTEYSQRGKIDDDKLLSMRKASPIEHAHRVKAATLLQIGSEDLRVPHHQGLEFYTRLKANGVEVRLNMYNDNHPLGTVPNEMDNLINTALWIEKHIS